jgi:uncharacterized protein
MILRLHSLNMSYNVNPDKELPRLIDDRLGGVSRYMKEWRTVRRSVDARQRPVRLMFSVDVTLDSTVSASQVQGAILPPERVPLEVEPGNRPLSEPPIVIGAGPAGLFASWLLAKHGYCPVLLDRGGSVEERVTALANFARNRVPNSECNALFGLGGAGTFSDGKLTTGVKHPWLSSVLEILVDCGAQKSILTDAKPHVGTDVLRNVVRNMVRKIENFGGIVRTGVRVDNLQITDSSLTGVATPQETIPTEAAILAIGHSARDTWHSLAASGLRLEPKPFQIGVRVEHPQEWVDEVRFGEAAGHPSLGAADYKLATKIDGTPVFSFCMCPGGATIPTVNEVGHLAINGMSMSARDSASAASGLVVTLIPDAYGGDDLASCLSFQRSVEAACFNSAGGDYRAPAQLLVDFARGSTSTDLPLTSYNLGVTATRLDQVLPGSIASPLQQALPQFDRRLKGYLHPKAVVLAPESRASSPLRILRDKHTREAVGVAGVYPVGEGAGYAGGIMSCALDGLNSAKAIIERYGLPR